MKTRWLIATRAPVVRRALKYAVGVGALLVAINQGDLILASRLDALAWTKMGLTVVVPYCVSTASSVSAALELEKQAPP